MQGLAVKGKVSVWQDGQLVCQGSNLVVQAGLELLARLVKRESGALLPSEFKLGESSATTTKGMTGLQGAQIAECLATSSRRSNVLSWTGSLTYTLDQAKICREMGLFNTESTPVMLARFLPVQQFTLKKGTPLQIVWEITIGD